MELNPHEDISPKDAGKILKRKEQEEKLNLLKQAEFPTAFSMIPIPEDYNEKRNLIRKFDGEIVLIKKDHLLQGVIENERVYNLGILNFLKDNERAYLFTTINKGKYLLDYNDLTGLLIDSKRAYSLNL